MPVLGTSARRFWRKCFVGCPKFSKTFFWKTRLPVLGTSARRFWAFWRVNVHFFARRFLPIFIFRICESIYGLACMRPKKFRKLPSTRRIFQKVFRRSHFWTSILVNFLKIFSTLVQIESKNNNFYFRNYCKKTRA